MVRCACGELQKTKHTPLNRNVFALVKMERTNFAYIFFFFIFICSPHFVNNANAERECDCECDMVFAFEMQNEQRRHFRIKINNNFFCWISDETHSNNWPSAVCFVDSIITVFSSYFSVFLNICYWCCCGPCVLHIESHARCAKVHMFTSKCCVWLKTSIRSVI